jgi:hypothetical protein
MLLRKFTQNMVVILVFMCLEDFACLEIGCVESLMLFIFEISFWRCELLKNDGRGVSDFFALGPN